MLRQEFNVALKEAMRAKDAVAVRTLRLIVAALKDRDIAARPRGLTDGIPDSEILGMLQSMVKQREESIRMYEQGGRCELAEQERDEIGVIRRFMPEQIDGAELEAAVRAVIQEIGAGGLKDMGRAMAELRSRYAGRIDFTKASAIVKQALS